MKAILKIAIITVMLYDCGYKVSNTKKDNDMEEKILINQKAIVDYWNEIGKYTISYSEENTIDSRYTCVVPEAAMIPERLQKPGIHVIFSGIVNEDPTLPLPRMGGEQVLHLAKLDNIQLFINP